MALLADAFVAVFGFAAAPHAGAESAAHALLEAQLTAAFRSVAQRTQHRQRTAGVEIVVCQAAFADRVGHETPHALRPVGRRHHDAAAQLRELVAVEDLRRRVEAQHDRDLAAVGQKPFGEIVERRDAHAAAHEQLAAAALRHVEAVAQPCEQVEPHAGPQAGHERRPLAHDFIDQRDRPFVPVADRDRAAQVAPVEFDVDELSGRRDPLRVAFERHAPYGRRQPFVGAKRVDCFLVHNSVPEF